MDVDNVSLSTAFISLLDSVGFSQTVHKPTYHSNHTLDLVLAYGIEIEHSIIQPHNHNHQQDHYLMQPVAPLKLMIWLTLQDLYI